MKFCEYCNGGYQSPDHRSRFCSLSCSASRKTVDEPAWKKRVKNCIVCDKEFATPELEQKHCSKSCGAVTSNKNRKRKERRSCKHCGKEVNNSQAIYCSNHCHSDYVWAAKKKQMEESGTAHNHYSGKKYLLELDRSCSICNSTEWMGQPIPLELDHIDGNSEDHSLSNLRLVCGNCGMQLPTYKGKNVGNGRHDRRQRYKEGKSY